MTETMTDRLAHQLGVVDEQRGVDPGEPITSPGNQEALQARVNWWTEVLDAAGEKPFSTRAMLVKALWLEAYVQGAERLAKVTQELVKR